MVWIAPIDPGPIPWPRWKYPRRHHQLLHRRRLLLQILRPAPHNCPFADYPLWPVREIEIEWRSCKPVCEKKETHMYNGIKDGVPGYWRPRVVFWACGLCRLSNWFAPFAKNWFSGNNFPIYFHAKLILWKPTRRAADFCGPQNS